MTVIVQHRVRHFDEWLRAFTDHRSVRERHGCLSHRVYRGLEDPNAVTIALEFEDLERAQAFYRDPSLHEAMQRGGVEGEPQVTRLRGVESVEYAGRRAA